MTHAALESRDQWGLLIDAGRNMYKLHLVCQTASGKHKALYRDLVNHIWETAGEIVAKARADLQ